MKNIAIVIILLIIIGIIWYFVSPKNTQAPDKNDVDISGTMPVLDQSVSGTFNIDVTSSKATWTGSKKLIANYYDTGSIYIKSGQMIVDKGLISGGNVVFDMKSIGAISTGRNSGETNLTNHLKSADFFDAEKFPEAKFVVKSFYLASSTDSYVLNGDLTIKDVTAPLSIPVQFYLEESGNFVVTGKANVDRTIWNVKYGSEKFFDKLGDNVINDIFTLEFRVVTKAN